MINVPQVQQMINEAYYGKEYVKSIESAMKEIHAVVSKDKYYQLNNSPENAKLIKAIKDTFGFKEVSVTWTNTATNTGPYTINTNPIITYIVNNDTAKHTPGKPYYDQHHVLCVAIAMDSSLIYDARLTPAELTAVLIHEIGHNFDFSPNKILGNISTIFNMLMRAQYVTLVKYVMINGVLTLVPYSKEAYVKIMELDTTISDIFPPLRKTFTFVRDVSQLLNKIKATLNISKYAKAAIYYTQFIPFIFIANYFTRAGEVYADSFAASYGYGAEIGTGLDKLTHYYSGYGKYDDMNLPTDPLIKIINDIMVFNSEIFNFILAGHGTNQQRANRVLVKLKNDLRTGNYSPKMRKELEQQIKQAEENYDYIINLSDDGRRTITTTFRSILDQWYSNSEKITLGIYKDSYTD